jgi:aminopeptidase-like protein
MASLYNRIAAWDNRKFTYRFVILPETIGSLTYLSKYGDHLQNNLVAGLVLTCLGGPEENLSYKETRREDALIDEVVRHIDHYMDQDIQFRRFDTRGSDERQYCSPGFNLPVGQFARTPYAEYDGYHNSLDTKEFMEIKSLVESAERIEQVLKTIEYGGYYLNQEPYGEPMMSKRDLYPTVNDPDKHTDRDLIRTMMRLLNYSDGTHSVVNIAERYDLSVDDMALAIDQLCHAGLLEPNDHTPEYTNRYN